ncbi:MAG: VWA domain-containing protein [Planctomycetes bacterium]|nr:VWA domain-containing protein [Planctomycetota bacterium]
MRCIPEWPAYRAGTDPLVRCLLKLAALPAKDAPPPPEVHILLVLDVSGSMNAPDRYPLVLQATRELVDRLPATARLTTVLFSDRVDVPVRCLPVMEVGGEQAARAVNASPAKFGGATLLAAGFREALAEAERFRKRCPGAIQRLYVMTDGHVHDPEQCREVGRDGAALEVEVRAFGFGEDFDFHALSDLTRGRKGGTIRRIATGDALQRELVHIGETADRIVASEARLTLTLAAGVIPGELLRYRPGRERYADAFKSGRAATLEVGAVEADRFYQYMIEFRLPRGPAGAFSWATARLDYVEAGKACTAEVRLLVERSGDATLVVSADPEVAEVAQILEPLRNLAATASAAALIARATRQARAGVDSSTQQSLLRALDGVASGRGLAELSDADRAALETETCSEVLDLRQARLGRLRVALRILALRTDAPALVEAVQRALDASEAGDLELAHVPEAVRATVDAVLRELGLE